MTRDSFLSVALKNRDRGTGGKESSTKGCWFCRRNGGDGEVIGRGMMKGFVIGEDGEVIR